MRRRVLPIASWLAVLASCGWWLLDAGGERLEGPDLGRPATWARWAEGRPPLDAAFAVVRLLALAAVAYLLVVTLAGMTTRALRRQCWAEWTDRVSVGLVRRVLDGAVGLGFTASALSLAAVPVAARLVPAVAGAGAGTTELAAGTATLQAIPPPSTATLVATTATDTVAIGPTGTAAIRAVPGPTAATMVATSDDTPPSATTTQAAPPPPVDELPAPTPSTPPTAPIAPTPEPVVVVEPAEAAPASDAPAADVAAPPTTWTVQPGEHLWSIAEAVVPAGATEAEVAAYWGRLVTLNRGVLADPDCPDLLFVGQVLELPPR